MRKGILALAWFFIIATTVFDCTFAHFHIATIREWEVNFLALWFIVHFGIGAIALYKTVAFATLFYALWRSRIRWLFTVVTAGLASVHLGLLALYLL